ncbi:MAG: C69 family dipeptidase [Catonella sp.]|nr:C69 family dipeptidase [Catonella sp.]MDY6356226.1 C69 family dipeptidase [Catonella sp.]
MPCTTFLAGKNATYNGSTMMARNEDSSSGSFDPKKFMVVNPADQPRHYKSVLSKFEIDLPDNPMRYTAMPNAIPKEGIWGEAGVNEMNVAMSETETITSNVRVLGADPLVKDGIGEEDMLTLVLPYIKSAREGVERLGDIITKYGTYEMNGIGFQDENEIWWFESIGGHHFIAKRVPDDEYVVMPNQQGIDSFDFTDAFGDQEENICSDDMIEFIVENDLDLMIPEDGGAHELAAETDFDVRICLGSHDDSDHVYNTPRAWAMERFLNPNTFIWEGPDADYTPESDDIPWSMEPERKVTVEDVKYVLSLHYQGTKFDPYGKYGDKSERGKYRPIGINRNNFVALTEIRSGYPSEIKAVEWIAEGSNVFNAFVPFYANVTKTPLYLANTNENVTTENFYWANRIIAALADKSWSMCNSHIERYQNKVHAEGHHMLNVSDRRFADGDIGDVHAFLEKCNDDVAAMVKTETDDLLSKVLYEASMDMKNAFSRSDA